MKKFYLFLFTLIFSGSTYSQTIYNYGDGFHGSHTVPATGEFADPVKHSISIVNSMGGQDEVVIGSANVASYAVDDYVLIINMCPGGCTGPIMSTSNYNIRIVRSITSSGLLVSYLSPGATNGCLQVIKLKRYTDLTLIGTLTCDPYNPGTGTGGVVCVLVSGTLTVSSSGKIDVSSKIIGPNGGAGGSAGLPDGTFGTAGGGHATPEPYPDYYGHPGFCFRVSGADACNYKGCGQTGGSGTYPKLGGFGGSSNPSLYPCFFGTGISGAGGRGPGSGGNGGGGGSSVGGNEMAGTAGQGPTGSGGAGGNGGDGGGFIYVRAGIIDVPSPHRWLISDGGDGGIGGDGGNGGDGGDGGDGAHAGCIAPNTWKDAGGYGGKGIGGNGGAGGNGGDGGDGGPIVVYTINNIPITTFNDYCRQNGGAGGAGGNGGTAGANGADGLNGTRLTEVQTCCPYTGGEGGASNPVITKELEPQTREYFCECWTIFHSLTNYYNTTPTYDGVSTYTYILNHNLIPPVNTYTSLILEINVSNGALKMTRIGPLTNGDYTGVLTEIFNCEVSTANLNNLITFRGNFDTQKQENQQYGFPRTLNFGSANDYWIYTELNPDYRYLEKNSIGSTRAYMQMCDFFETSNGTPLAGWPGIDGGSGDGKSPNQINQEPSAIFNEQSMKPEIINNNYSGETEETHGFEIVLNENKESGAEKPKIILQPNPANTQLQVKYSNLPIGQYILYGSDASGRIVTEQQVNIALESTGILKINVSSWPVGTYFIRINSNKINLEQRAIISR